MPRTIGKRRISMQVRYGYPVLLVMFLMTSYLLITWNLQLPYIKGRIEITRIVYENEKQYMRIINTSSGDDNSRKRNDVDTGTSDAVQRYPKVHANDTGSVNASMEVMNGSFVVPSGETKRRPITIRFYRPYHAQLIDHKRHLRMQECYYDNCEVTFAKMTEDAMDADAILFQGNNMPTTKPRRRDQDQVFVFLDYEPPQYANIVPISRPWYHEYFNWTMTYRMDSDIIYPYGAIVPNNDITAASKGRHGLFGFIHNVIDTANDDTVNNATDNHFKYIEHPLGIPGKDYNEIFKKKSVTAAIKPNHCVTPSKTEAYVTAMAKHVDVQVYGECGKDNCSNNIEECYKMIVSYSKFYLAFEDSLCIDFITEKAYRIFPEDIILVVRGARNYSNLLPPGTYVNAHDFVSPRHLADFLIQLGSDEDQYIDYLKRKDNYKVIREQQSAQTAYCELCKKLNKLELHRKTLENIYTWWKQDKCTQPYDIYGIVVHV